MGTTIALAQAAGIEAGYLPSGWEIKVISGAEDPDGPAPAAQLIASDESTGEVTAIVGITNVVDHVGDVIMPGAYTKTLAKRRPKVCWAHSWEVPIGKVLRIEEWPPGDPRFAKVNATLDGKAWPADAGALVAHMQMNLKSDKGREAFAAVQFYSETGECEWSIGWQPIPAKTLKRKDGVRECKEVELYEVSPVLFGAAPHTRTLQVKSLNLHDATPAGVAANTGRTIGSPGAVPEEGAPLNEAAPQPGEADPVDEATLHRNAMDEIDWDEVDAAAATSDAPAAPGTPAAAAGGNGLTPEEEAEAEAAAGGDEPDDDPEAAAEGEGEEAAAPDSPKDEDDDDEDDEDEKKKGAGAPPFVKKKGADGDLVIDAKSLAAFTDGLDLAALGVGLPEVKAEGGADLMDGLTLHEAVRAVAGRRRVSVKRLARALAMGATAGVAAGAARGAARAGHVDIYVPASALSGKSALDVDQLRDGVEVIRPDAVVRAAQVVEDVLSWDGADDEPVDDSVRLLMTALEPDSSVASVVVGVGPDHAAASDRYRDLGQHTLARGAKSWQVVTPGGATVGGLAEASGVHGPAAPLFGTGTLHGPTVALLADVLVKAEGGADKNRGGAEQLRRWYVKGEGAARIAWGTPGDWTRCVAIASPHMGERAKGYCQLRHKDALGIYTGDAANRPGVAGKAFDAADRLAKSWNPLLEVGVHAAHDQSQRKFLAEGIDGLRGSFEQRQEKLRRGIEPVLQDEIGWKRPPSRAVHETPVDDGCWTSIEGTWNDRVVATIVRYGPERTKQTFVVPYSWDGDEVSFGKPQPVELQVSIVPAVTSRKKDDDADELFAAVVEEDQGLDDALMLPAISLLSTGVGAIKGALVRSPEVKAGRVLSEANASRLRGALEHLLEVARSAGIDLPGWTGPEDDPADDGALPDTTAAPVTRPVAGRGAPTAVKVLTVGEIEADLASLAPIAQADVTAQLTELRNFLR